MGSILAFLIVFFSICNITTAVIGSKEQVGTAQGYEWAKTDSFDIAKVKSLEAGNEDFKILCLTDIHYKNWATFGAFMGINYLLDWTSTNEMKALVKQTAPDLIIVTGDTTLTKRNDIEYKRFVKVMDSFEIPWGCVFGNHDEEGRADKAKLVDVLLTSEYGIFEYGAKDLHGAGNYAVNITRGNDVAYSLYMMDSGTKIEVDGESVYDNINKNQIDWYKWNVDGINKASGKAVPNMAFFHIALPEYALSKEYISGESKETAGKTANFGFFDVFKANGGTQTFAGHDHSNNFTVDYQGVKLTYVQKSSYNCYFKSGMTGGTLLTIKADNSTTTEIIDF